MPHCGAAVKPKADGATSDLMVLEQDDVVHPGPDAGVLTDLVIVVARQSLQKGDGVGKQGQKKNNERADRFLYVTIELLLDTLFWRPINSD